MRVLFWFLLFFLNASLQAEIIECPSFREVLSYLVEGDLLLTELDNVLLKPKVELSSTPFFNHLKQEMLRQSFEPDEVLQKLYPLWVKVQKKSEMDLSDPELPRYFNILKNQHIISLAFSHRGPFLALHSHELMHHLGLCFEDVSPLHEEIFAQDEWACFFEGMLFMHPSCDKGEYVLKILNGLKDLPKRVVCIDYELVHLINVKQALESQKIPFLGIYYKNHDLNLSDYTVKIGSTQLEYLDKILPDRVASILIERSQNDI